MYKIKSAMIEWTYTHGICKCLIHAELTDSVTYIEFKRVVLDAVMTADVAQSAEDKLFDIFADFFIPFGYTKDQLRSLVTRINKATISQPTIPPLARTIGEKFRALPADKAAIFKNGLPNHRFGSPLSDRDLKDLSNSGILNAVNIKNSVKNPYYSLMTGQIYKLEWYSAYKADDDNMLKKWQGVGDYIEHKGKLYCLCLRTKCLPNIVERDGPAVISPLLEDREWYIVFCDGSVIKENPDRYLRCERSTKLMGCPFFNPGLIQQLNFANADMRKMC